MSAAELVALYRLHAAQCVHLSHKLSDSKVVLLDMAQSWVILAEQAKRNSETTLVYETPEPRRHAAQERQRRQPDDPKTTE
ncbi:MAG TPA: hypothetical protein VGH13_15650 [Xanthobacteraceae bacterium]|jgi:hypothetical protein